MIGLINHVFIQLVFSEVWISLFWYQILTCFILLVHFPVHFCSYREKFISLYCRLSAVAELDSLNTQQSLRKQSQTAKLQLWNRGAPASLRSHSGNSLFYHKAEEEGRDRVVRMRPKHERTAVWAKDHYVQNRLLIWLKCRTQGNTSFKQKEARKSYR